MQSVGRGWVDMVSVRLVKEAPIMSSSPICNPEDAIRLVGDWLCEFDREAVAVLNLATNGAVINCSLVSIGELSCSIAHPRELLKSSILSNAASIIMVHNHPSGKILPSKVDTVLTERMIRVCSLINIPLKDHIIVGGCSSDYFSFRAKGIINYECDLGLGDDFRNVSFSESKGIVAEDDAS